MKADKMSISLDAELAAEVRAAAKRAGGGVSAWLADAAAAKLRQQAVREALDEWQREDGPVTDEELALAREELGLTRREVA